VIREQALAFPLEGIPEQIASMVRPIVPPTYPEPPHLVLQGRTLKTEAFGRSTVTRDLPGRRRQCVEDDLPLGFMEGGYRGRNPKWGRAWNSASWSIVNFALMQRDAGSSNRAR